MQIVKWLCPSLLIAVFSSSLGYAAVADRITGPLTSGQSVPLAGNVHHKALPQYDQGPVDPAMRLGTITLMTLPTAGQQKALRELLAEQQDRKSPNYHKWLTPEQYADRFGLSRHDAQQIASWLKAQGFGMVQVARGRNWVSFTGTAAQVQSAFGTEIHRYNVDGELHYANATAPAIPAALAGVVTAFRGMDDFRPRPRGIRRARPYYYSSTLGDLVAPGDIATIYDINALYTAGIDGTGQKLAVMGQTDIYLSDITDFRTGFGFSSISCTTNSSGVITACSDPHLQYVLDGADPGLSTTGDISEADLDLEWAGAIARNAQLIYVNSSDSFTSYYYAIDNTLAPVISLSYGVCEFGDNLLSSDETELLKANSEGITFVNSTGDTGAAECDNPTTSTPGNLAVNGIAVSYPASSPEVTGAGGTGTPLADLDNSTYWGTSNGTDGGSALSYIPEQAWNDDLEFYQFCQSNSGNPFCSTGNGTGTAITSEATAQNAIGISSSGGGASNCATQNSTFTQCVSGFQQPAWQTVTISGQASARFSPDVSFVASPNFPGYIFCTELSELGDTGTGSACAPGGSAGITNALGLSTPSIIGGTSVAAPVFAGMVTLLNQYLAGPSSPGLGNVNPTLYSLAATPANGAFHAVTTGDNLVSCQPNTPSTQPVALQCPSTGVLGFSASNYDATNGYNLVTGLGSVDANKLAAAWAATRASSSAALVPSTTQTYQSASVKLTATVTPSTATGNVVFNNGSTRLGIVALSGGTAVLTTSALPVATNSITATYGGSGTVANSTSPAATVTVVPAFTLAPSAASYQVAQGGSVTANVTVTPAGGFSGGLQFSCSDPASESTCTGPTSATTQTTVSFTITARAPVAELRPPLDRGMRIFYAALLPGLLGILFTAGSGKRSLGGMRLLGLIVALGFSTLWLSSCGGSGNSSNTDPGTPPGTYTMTVNATTGGANAATGQTTFKLVVVP